MTNTPAKLWNKDFLKISSANLLMAFPFYIMLIILPLYLQDQLGATASQVGQVQFLFTIMAVLFRPITGYLLDRYNRKAIYLSFFAIFTFCMLGFPYVGSIIGVSIIRLIQGIGWGGTNTSGSTIAIDLVPVSRRGEGIGVFGMSMTVATAFGPILGHALLGWSASYITTFLASFGIATLGLLIASLVSVPKFAQAPRKLSLATMFSKRAVPAGIFVINTQIAYGFVMGFIALYATTLTDANAGVFFLLYAAFVFVARYMAGRVFDKQGPGTIVPVAIVLTAIGFLISAFNPTAMGLYIGAIPMGLGFGSIMSTTQAIANHGVVGRERGVINSTYLTFMDSGIGIGMLLFGWIVELYGYFYAQLTCVMILLISVMIFFGYTYPAFRRGL